MDTTEPNALASDLQRKLEEAIAVNDRLVGELELAGERYARTIAEIAEQEEEVADLHRELHQLKQARESNFEGSRWTMGALIAAFSIYFALGVVVGICWVSH